MVAEKSGARSGVDAKDDFSLLDSLELVELLQEVESYYGVRIPADALDALGTIEDLARFVEAHRC